MSRVPDAALSFSSAHSAWSSRSLSSHTSRRTTVCFDIAELTPACIVKGCLGGALATTVAAGCNLATLSLSTEDVQHALPVADQQHLLPRNVGGVVLVRQEIRGESLVFSMNSVLAYREKAADGVCLTASESRPIFVLSLWAGHELCYCDYCKNAGPQSGYPSYGSSGEFAVDGGWICKGLRGRHSA